MREAEEFRRQADECFRRAEACGHELSRSLWLGLSKQWSRMVDEAEPVRRSTGSAAQSNLRGIFDEILFEKALALSAARVSGGPEAPRVV